MQQQEELQRTLSEFVGAFEMVFRYDWEYTRIMIGDEAAGATFIEPGLEHENNDWGARGALLEKYRLLVEVMKKNGLSPEFPFPLTNLSGAPKRIW